MARDDAKKVFEHLEKAREASAPLKDPGLTKKIETAQEHIKKRVDPDKGSPKGVESAVIPPAVHLIVGGRAFYGNTAATRFTLNSYKVSCAGCAEYIIPTGPEGPPSVCTGGPVGPTGMTLKFNKQSSTTTLIEKGVPTGLPIVERSAPITRETIERAVQIWSLAWKK
jgi:hypothetical protein